MSIDLRAAAKALGGEVSGHNQVNCPGPRHGEKDRSLSVLFDPSAADGFVVRCYSNRDDEIECRDYVRERLGLPPWRPGKRRRYRPIHPGPKPATRTDEDKTRIERAESACGTKAMTRAEQPPRHTSRHAGLI